MGEMIDTSSTWHRDALSKLSEILRRDADVLAVVLTGSMADPKVVVDRWSDVDLKIVIEDPAVDRYVQSIDWLQPFGRLIGMERHKGPFSHTLRLCFKPYRRFDLSFLCVSAIADGAANLVPPTSIIVWSRLPDLEATLPPSGPPKPLPAVTGEEIVRMADDFGFKAAVAIGKVARNDLLIGAHLALDLMRDVLVLQMMRRDQTFGTTVHRIGGWGHDVMGRIVWDPYVPSCEAVLRWIATSLEIFDELAHSLSPAYRPRGGMLFPMLEDALDVCRSRTDGVLDRE